MKKKYFLDDLDFDEEINLLAIHSNLEGYQLAFEINQATGARFKRSKKDIDLPQLKAFYTRFTWIDPKTDQHFDLFTNSYKKVSSNKKGKKITLFEQAPVKKVYLLKQYNNVNYFIKTNHLEQLRLLKNKLKKLNSISMLYVLPSSKINNPQNLIFD